MGKSKREIILDFTPLLDVMMLILFFFILFANTNYQNKIEEANAMHSQKLKKQKKRKKKLNPKLILTTKRLKNLRKNLTH